MTPVGTADQAVARARYVLLAERMPHPLRWYLPGVTYETTIRTIDSRFLLRPDDASRGIVDSVIARALRLYPNVRLHAYDAQSNHLHMELSSTDGASIAPFLRYVHGNLARELGKLRGWTGPFWSRRVRVIPIVDDDAIVARFRYILAQGVAAGLVASPREWPGASAVAALLGSMRVVGRWVSSRQRHTNARRAHPLPVESLAETVEATLSPIAPWRGLSHDALVAQHASMIEDIEREHAHRVPLGAERVRAADPMERPMESDVGPAPACHASSRPIRERFTSALRAFRDAFLAATRRILSPTEPAATVSEAGFPVGSSPRPGVYVRPPSRDTWWPPWTEPTVDRPSGTPAPGPLILPSSWPPAQARAPAFGP